MRLGWVQRAPLPSTRKALLGYVDRRFAATPAGEEWFALAGDDRRAAYDALLRELWRIRPQLAGYLRMLQSGRFGIPTAGWQEVHPDLVDDDPRVQALARATCVDFLAERAAGAIA